MDDKFVIYEKYAEALFGYCRQHSLLEQVKSDLDVLIQAVNLEPQFLYWLSIPIVEMPKKKELIDSVSKAFGFQDVVKWFLYVLVEKKRITMFPGIYNKFSVFYSSYHHRVDVKLVSPRKLTDSERQLFLHIWGTYLKQWINLKEEIDESLLGGIKVYYRGYLYDASLKKRLELLKEELVR